MSFSPFEHVAEDARQEGYDVWTNRERRDLPNSSAGVIGKFKKKTQHSLQTTLRIDAQPAMPQKNENGG
jgi:hypothetical protein